VSSPERGYYFETGNSHEPIEGPKTLQETEEDQEHARRLAEHLAFYSEHRIKESERKISTWDRWIPRLEDIDSDPESQVKVMVEIDELGYQMEWTLRKGMEWADFKFLTNSKLGRDEWVAWTDGYIWDGEVHGESVDGEIVNGGVIKPRQGQCIHVLTGRHYEEKLRAKREAQNEAWNRICDRYPNFEDWSLSEEERESGLEKRLTEAQDREDPYVFVSLPIEQGGDLVSLQVPRGNEWAYFTAFMDSFLGEDRWIAGFELYGELTPWIRADVIPLRNQFIIVRMLKEEEIPGMHRPKLTVWVTEMPEGDNDWSQFVQYILCPKPCDPVPQPLTVAEPVTKMEGTQEVRDTRLDTSERMALDLLPRKLRAVPLFQGSVHEARVKGRTKRKVVFWISLADAWGSAMGGKFDPLQTMQFGGQTPLSTEAVCPSVFAETITGEMEGNSRPGPLKDPGTTSSEDEEEDDWIDHNGPPQ
jgi:hypothetical protein